MLVLFYVFISWCNGVSRGVSGSSRKIHIGLLLSSDVGNFLDKQ
jgi:hypothetical protein